MLSTGYCLVDTKPREVWVAADGRAQTVTPTVLEAYLTLHQRTQLSLISPTTGTESAINTSIISAE